MTAALEIAGLSHAFGRTRVLDDVSCTVEPREIVCLLGPSGCGKTTLLRLAAGLERVQTGAIKLHGQTVGEPGWHVPPESRRIGLMFQDYALFPHLTIAENVAFGISGLPAGRRRPRVHEVLFQVNMQAYADSYPHTLSGGQQQRVALARVLAPKPEVVLLDEPFSGLDETLRNQVREETLRVLRQAGTAVLMVTHHPEEAMFMSDRMMVMGPGGIIHQAGAPAKVYANPANRFVATFFGRTNLMSGVVRNGVVDTPLGSVAAGGRGEGCAVDVVFRSNGVNLSTTDDQACPVEIVSARPVGQDTRVQFRLAGDEAGATYLCRVPGIFTTDGSAQVTARLDPAGAFVFHRGGPETERTSAAGPVYGSSADDA